jgi:hypothetical protein
LAHSVLKSVGDPRDWADSNWMRERTIRELDLSGMLVSAARFSGLVIQRCVFDDAMFVDCELSNISLFRSGLAGAAFYDCDFRGSIFLEGNTVTATIVETDDDFLVCNSEHELFEALRVGQIAEPVGPETRDVVGDVKEIVSKVLAQLVTFEGVAPRFHSRPLSEFSDYASGDSTSRELVRRVVIQRLRSSILEQELRAGSIRFVGIRKRWHAAVANLLRDGRLTDGMADLVGQIATKASRYFS